MLLQHVLDLLSGQRQRHQLVAERLAGKENGAVTYADLFASQPFRNQLVTMTLTGKQIKDMLEQQWLDPKRPQDPAGVEGLFLCLGRDEAGRRTRHR